MGDILKCQRADEQTHGEADTGDQRHAVIVPPTNPVRQTAKPQADTKHGHAHNAKLLAKKEARRNT